MEAMGPTAQIIAKYGRLTRPSEIDLVEIEENRRHCLLIAIIKEKHGEETMIGIQDAQVFNETIEGWKAALAQELSLWLVRNLSRTELACDFVRHYGRRIEVEKNPLTWKGLDFSGGKGWAIILNDAGAHPQGELFPADSADSKEEKPIIISADDNENYQLFRRAWKRGELTHFDIYKLSKKIGEQFRSIHPKWIQRKLTEQLQEKEAVRIPILIDEAV